MANATDWKPADTEKAEQTWAAYQRQHDVADKFGMTAGIEPHSGRIWFGKSIGDVIAQRDAEGIDAPLFLERIGFPAYFRKGGHR